MRRRKAAAPGEIYYAPGVGRGDRISGRLFEGRMDRVLWRGSAMGCWGEEVPWGMGTEIEIREVFFEG